MLWFRLLGLPDPQTETNQRNRQTDIRVSALLDAQKRALEALDRELELYHLQNPTPPHGVHQP